jgi:uncharacterized damage-inducible protein DinB
MSIAEAMLAEFEQESITTRKFLERVPRNKLGWKPHGKSMSVGQLALHIASAPAQLVEMAGKDEVPMPDFGGPLPEPGSVGEVLDAFERSIAAVQKAVLSFDDSKMQAVWKGTRNGKDVFVMPRVALLRSILLNHCYHHRGQLSVYLRILDVPVPSTYGPSADELPDVMQDN